MNALDYLTRLQPAVTAEMTQLDRIKYHFIAATKHATNQDATLNNLQTGVLKDWIELESLANPMDDLEKLRTAMKIARYINTCHE